MLLNEDKSKYVIFTKTHETFSTRITMNNNLLERVSEITIMGVWFNEKLDWSTNTSNICRKAYSRIRILTKLKYVGTKTNDLVEIYKLKIRSVLEYCSSLYHSTLTQQQESDIESVQKTCLKVIFGTHLEYDQLLTISGL